ncbi:putative fatty acid elongase [Aspergillus japonicus CBS 114.51]|uniref:Elongation of fatty acids protein n=2 Tax=Aspergillus TaxID=5052 RepID=A0A2V5HFR9_ASPV1|nr:putative fatty acid elongase [Aspergillus japonicus CBS 114.51]PYI21312.1 putative fatty acid elongase [Aspergillus violaceofuscus CBS 115571]RAH85399.1 putative fatty acid elongase [Aspergillus japonicus CBS 114.51]
MAAELLQSLPRPTIDRPFGIHLWPIFDKAFELVVGYPASEFRFVEGVTPMSTFKETAVMLVAYYVIIFGGRAFMKDRPAFKLNALFMIHNFYLTAISATLLALFIEQLLPTIWRHGIFYTICTHEGGLTQPLVVLYYLNYLTKYLELLDTVFLFLKKKPLTFLHTYHHGATALLCYTQLIGLTAVQWVVIDINLLVHVVMYWYYFQSARGIRIWWKEWITRLQIIQFVIDLGFIYFASYTYFSSTYFPWAPNMGKCAGEEFAAFSGIAVITSYLFLFISFYVATYNKAAKTGRPRRNTGRQAVIDMAKFEVSAPSTPNGQAKTNGAAVSTGRSNGPVTRSRKA